MNPTGGVGALMAMHDAVALANWISTLRLPSVSDLEDVFKEYRAERHPVAKEAFERSQLFTKNLGKVWDFFVTHGLVCQIQKKKKVCDLFIDFFSFFPHCIRTCFRYLSERA